MTTQPDPTRPNFLKTREYTDYNGYLRHVPGQDISAGSRMLPVASEGEKHTLERKAEIYSQELNAMVRITYRLAKHKHHKTTTWSWVANWADLAEG